MIKLLKNQRKKLGISQSKLARKLKKPQSYVSRYESGEQRLDLVELKSICNALNLSIIDLIVELERLENGL